ncbi:YkgJ family cysteine cluster protein [Rufibacter hautae]|uniref:YkgJ family cysteine cluster protein n=1 Tax=Rufibacter hautae TaxID=2595005 RepID=A0A5B6TIN7_9BACT|nr:YkgJ family cysteine cluster protein [Rufibacter hautae]KAA3439235.1 YkgJ family cysteine cluster protein [Rufibacter hautae]
MNDPTNICLSCGFCCDGTVVGFVQLSREELPLLSESSDVENTNGEGFFLQPCSNYCNGCSIYSKRPRHCASYACALLEAVEQKQIDFDSAIKIVEVVRQKKMAIESRLPLLPFELRSQSFYFKMTELKKLLQSDQAESLLVPNHLDLMSDLDELDWVLSKEFGASIFD